MKKLLLSLLFLVLAGSLLAQPMHYNWQNVGTSSNTFPFGQTAGKAVNWLFLPNSLTSPTPCPSGQEITKVYWWWTSGGSRTYTNFHILMAQATITNLTTGAFYAGPWDTVYFNASLPMSGTTNSWSTPITLDTPFPYDPTKSLLMFVGQCGGSGSGMYIRQNTSPGGIKRVWSVGGCPFTPYSGGDASTLNFGVDVQASGPAGQILFKNDSLITHPGGGYNGADRSAIATPGTLYGFGWQQTASNRMADDFIVPPGVIWKIDSIQLYGYQTGGVIGSSSFTGCSMQITEDTVTGTAVFGNETSNKMTASYWSGIYRTTATAPTANTRPIMVVTDTCGGLELPSGTYWISVSATGSLASGPWMPPITIGNQQVTGNGLQKTTTGWAPAVDGAAQKGVPMVIYGTILTGVTNPTTTPMKYELSQNYPNPFNPVTNINFSIAKAGPVKLRVFDVLGREVANLVNDTRVAGNYTVSFDGSGLSSGAYFYRLEAGDFISVKKMMLTK